MNQPVHHEFDPADFAPFDMEQIYFAHVFLYRDEFRSFGFDELDFDGESSVLLLESMAFYINTHCPNSEPRTSDECDALVKKLDPLVGFDYLYSGWVHLIPDPWWVFMNWGYFDFENNNQTPVLTDPLEQDWRYAIQLYLKTIGDVDIRDKDVLEVGSGRCGGAAYLARELGPRSYAALDGTRSNVDYASRRHRDVDRLSFHHGRAESLPFDDGSFDAVINIESCQYYQPVEDFLAEVFRVLRPGGSLLLSTMGDRLFFMTLRRECLKLGFEPIHEQDITLNVYAAMENLDYRSLVMKYDTVRRKEIYLDFFERIYHPAQTINKPFTYYCLSYRKPSV